jgi:hypothetical protein
MNDNPSPSPLQPQARWAKDKLLLAGEWLVPIVVWLVVVTMSLGIAGLLLGED